MVAIVGPGHTGKKQRAHLQENGYALLSLAYFEVDGIPKSLDRISIDGLHKAVLEAAQNPQINQ